jgi:hypothetical protein
MERGVGVGRNRARPFLTNAQRGEGFLELGEIDDQCDGCPCREYRLELGEVLQQLFPFQAHSGFWVGRALRVEEASRSQIEGDVFDGHDLISGGTGGRVWQELRGDLYGVILSVFLQDHRQNPAPGHLQRDSDEVQLRSVSDLNSAFYVSIEGN